MKQKAVVCILMSTYNGQRFIREQIESLLWQEEVEVRIIIRDDGSKDQTVSILSDYASKHENIVILLEENCGAEESFNRLCRYALKRENADYYAFCDQDDVWERDKLAVAIDTLRKFNKNKPNLYFSNIKMVDENLNFLRNMYQENEVFTDREKTLVQIFTYGCTCVFNRIALEYYCTPEQQQTFHDNWIYCICSYLGNVSYDATGHILYRQHENNLSGHHSKGLELMYSRVKRILKGNLGHNFEILATQLLVFENEFDIRNLQIIRLVSIYRKNLFYKIKLLFSPNYKSGNFIKDLCIKYRILTNSL